MEDHIQHKVKDRDKEKNEQKKPHQMTGNTKPAKPSPAQPWLCAHADDDS